MRRAWLSILLVLVVGLAGWTAPADTTILTLDTLTVSIPPHGLVLVEFSP